MSISASIGVDGRVARDVAANSQVVELGGLGSQTRLDVAQASMQVMHIPWPDRMIHKYSVCCKVPERQELRIGGRAPPPLSDGIPRSNRRNLKQRHVGSAWVGLVAVRFIVAWCHPALDWRRRIGLIGVIYP